MDFVARHPTGDEELIQVCADATAAAVSERELRALIEAGQLHPMARRRLEKAAIDPDSRRIAGRGTAGHHRAAGANGC